MLKFDTFFFFQAEDGIRDVAVTGVQTCALPILPRLTDSRRISPVETWGIFSCLAKRCACVPLPTPGAPKKTRRIALPASSFQPSLGQEPLIVAHEHVRLDLLRRVQAHADGDQQ